MGTSSLLCALALAAFAQDGPPEDAQLYWDKGRLLAVFESHIELYRYGSVTPAVERPEHEARPLRPGVSVRGFPAFLDKRGRKVDIRPRRQAFGGALSVPPEKSAASPTVSICSKAEGGYCGVIGLDGEEVMSLRGGEEPGLRREPAGSKTDGTEALFALTRARGDGTREVTGYRLWRKRKGQPPREELLPPDDPQVQVLLDSYQGPLLDDPDRALPYREDRPLRRRR